jgi:hypothetical protein
VYRRRLCAAARAWHWILTLAAAIPGAALAQTHFTPYADAQYEQDTNYFDISTHVPQPIGNNGPGTGLSYERYRAGFEAEYDWGQQEFIANAEGRRFQFQDFTILDHDEYLVHGGLKWKLGGIFDGLLDYSRERSQVSYLNFNAVATEFEQLYLQVQDIATASANIQISPEWRLENQGKINNLDSPRPNYPNLTLREDSVDEGFKYTGFANLSAGVVAEYLDGRFTSGNEFLVTPRYHQVSADLAADYSLSGLSVFHGAVGYTKRDLEQAGTISGLTGLISYERDLTAKTSVLAKLSRALNVYYSGAAPEIDTIGELDIVWQATSKIGLLAGYQWQHSDIGATDIVGYVAPSRVDRLQTPSASAKYQVLEWLSLRPYVQFQSRQSSIRDYEFIGNTYGVEVEVRFGAPQRLTLTRP